MPSERVLNSRLSGPAHGEVIKIEAVEVVAGDVAVVRFLGSASPWRQGVWLGTEGYLEVAGKRMPQVVLWIDTSPGEVHLSIVQTDGVLRLYNVWDSGRGLGPFESQAATSGMVLDGGVYRCSDIATDPTFDRLEFSVEVRPA
jgi:hypothetical protein